MEKYSIEIVDLVKHYSAETKLSQVFADIEGDLNQESRVVCRYIINGMELSETDEFRLSTASLSEIKTIEVLVEDLKGLIVDVVNSWIEALPELVEKTEKFCDSIRTVHGKKQSQFAEMSSSKVSPYVMKISMTAFNNLFENCEYLVASLDSLKDVAPQLSIFKEEGWVQAISNMKSVLFQCLTTFEESNFQELANVLEFDLIPCFEAWTKQLIELRIILVQSGEYECIDSNKVEPKSKCFVGWKVRPH